MALVVHPDGTIDDVELVAGQHLRQMYEWLDCRSVDVVSLTSHLDMWLDDEGAFTQSVNVPASLLARRFGYDWQNYYGPALLCTHTNGESQNLSRDQKIVITTHLNDVAEMMRRS